MKRRPGRQRRDIKKSPPRTGAWIETTKSANDVVVYNVAPSHGGVD